MAADHFITMPPYKLRSYLYEISKQFDADIPFGIFLDIDKERIKT